MTIDFGNVFAKHFVDYQGLDNQEAVDTALVLEYEGNSIYILTILLNLNWASSTSLP